MPLSSVSASSCRAAPWPRPGVARSGPDSRRPRIGGSLRSGARDARVGRSARARPARQRAPAYLGVAVAEAGRGSALGARPFRAPPVVQPQRLLRRGSAFVSCDGLGAPATRCLVPECLLARCRRYARVAFVPLAPANSRSRNSARSTSEKSNSAGSVLSMKSISARAKRTGWSMCTKWPDSSKTSSSLPGIARWALSAWAQGSADRACPTGSASAPSRPGRAGRWR